ncbi:uncharacterized protein LOC127003611 [Eriocheir sinensis]|uniref:uncharacterized protein LOC127003611 n=1 Tax=Eriocheir sinensis TaxID=95602 RepID=UPI0021C5FF75|nr:uncharacterized protein LOC127003611 [Eriocheir sinensis]
MSEGSVRTMFRIRISSVSGWSDGFVMSDEAGSEGVDHDANNDTTAAKERKENAAAGANEETPTPDKQETAVDNVFERADSTFPSDDTEDKGKFFLKPARSSSTWTFLSSFTSTVPYTCYRSGEEDVMVCMGRRLRRSHKLASVWDNKDSERLHGSILEEDTDSQAEEKAGDGKFFFKVWTTIGTTVTVTTFSTNRSVTVSVSVACTFPGAVINLC